MRKRRGEREGKKERRGKRRGKTGGGLELEPLRRVDETKGSKA